MFIRSEICSAMIVNPNDDLNPNSKVVHTELNDNWFESMTQHDNPEALNNIKIVLLQNMGEETLEDPNRPETRTVGEERRSGG